MPVLKQQSMVDPGHGAVVLDMADLARQADQIKAAARQEAERLMSEAVGDASREAEKIMHNAAEEGRAAGYAAGMEEGREVGRAEALKETADALAAVERGWLQATAQWEEDRHRIMDGCEASVVELAWRLAEKIVRRVADVDRTLVLTQINEALTHVMRSTQVTVRIHSEDRMMVEETMPELMACFARFESLNWEEDDTVGRGGCVVTYGEGSVDANIETQLQRLAEQVIRPSKSDDAGAATVSPGEEAGDGDREGEAL